MLVLAGLLYRMDLRTQVVGAQEIVGDAQPAGRVPFQQVKSAVAPEIRQGNDLSFSASAPGIAALAVPGELLNRKDAAMLPDPGKVVGRIHRVRLPRRRRLLGLLL
jgi:hypothetical protein